MEADESVAEECGCCGYDEVICLLFSKRINLFSWDEDRKGKSEGECHDTERAFFGIWD